MDGEGHQKDDNNGSKPNEEDHGEDKKKDDENNIGDEPTEPSYKKRRVS